MRHLALPRALPRSAARWRLRGRSLAPGVVAIVVKELRGRMRARRAFAILTAYLVLLAGFGWMLEQMNESSSLIGSCFDVGPGPARSCAFTADGSTMAYTGAAIGRGIFVGLMMLLTLVVAVLAPASTAGAISGERERQTLDLLAVTPISSPAIVLGKLASALAWVVVLILASIPVTALVFVFGGVAPDDIVRSYLLLGAVAVGMGSIGLFFSALLRRTGASTALTFVTMLALTVGSIFAWEFLYSTSARSAVTGMPKPPSDALLYLNPFAGQADIACGTEGGFGTWCGVMTAVADGSTDLITPLLMPYGGAVRLGGPLIAPVPMKGVDLPADRLIVVGGVAANGSPDAVMPTSLSGVQDQLWRRSVAAYLGLAALLTVLAVQLVSPSRRWRPRRQGLRSALAAMMPGRGLHA